MARCVSGYGLCRHGGELDGHVETWLGGVTGCHWVQLSGSIAIPVFASIVPDAGELVSEPFDCYSFPEATATIDVYRPYQIL